MLHLLGAAAAIAVLSTFFAATKAPGPVAGGAGEAVARPVPIAPAPAAPPADQEVLTCVYDLARLGERMNEEGYWLSGYHRFGAGWGGFNRPNGGGASAGGDGDPRAPVDARIPAAAAVGGDPGFWGDLGWAAAPGYQIRVLYAAAKVLALRGDGTACRALLQEVHETYEDYASRLREAGVQPGQIASWRQEQILAARPVTEQARAIRVDNLPGTELRNRKDEALGRVEDMVLDPASGRIAYVIVSHGGFLGMGRERVAVPWSLLHTTPGLNALVLDLPPQAVRAAPRFDANGAGTSWRDVDRYWQEQFG